MMRVLTAGLLSTVQDLGRPGFRRFGVVMGGAVDVQSHTVANLLVGNPPSAATVEMTLTGARLTFPVDTWIALAGADMRPTADGVPIPMYRPLLLPAQSVLSCGSAVSGCRTYLAVAGGIAVHPVLASRSTYVPAAIGGIQGKPLLPGDVLSTGTALRMPMERVCWAAAFTCRIPGGDEVTVRVLPGQHWEAFREEARKAFLAHPYDVSPSSDRMGMQLTGPVLRREDDGEVISFGVAPGTIQVPSAGQPIVLLADAQVTGGYPVIAHVATVDLPVLAQRRSGQRVRFAPIGLREAQELLVKRHREIQQLRYAAAWRLRHGRDD